MVEIITYDPAKDAPLLTQVRDMHVDVVTIDGSMMRFVPPFTEEKKARMLATLEARAAEVAEGQRDIILAVDGAADDGSSSSSSKVVGAVMLAKPVKETGPFRGVVEMLMVSPRARRQGIARRLMVALEEHARASGRTMLTLDTTVGTPAADVYPRFGYVEIGRVPDYGYLPAKNMELAEEVFFYKDLNKSKPM